MLELNRSPAGPGPRPPQATQWDVFETVAARQVDNCLDGFNATIFAYGQTGTGKTYTMEGKGDKETQGVIPNSFDRVFEAVEADESGRDYLIKASGPLFSPGWRCPCPWIPGHSA